MPADHLSGPHAVRSFDVSRSWEDVDAIRVLIAKWR